ncbi:MAG: hypothetical protein DRO40_07700 [Thermoprotei archaeon]|nr:MAG: hypothetical protein DRO40_07700 [Thermoprotei archaeon]
MAMISFLEEVTHDGIKIAKYKMGDLIVGVALNIGPRVLYLSHSSRPEFNVFGIDLSVQLETEDGVWKLYGGHRLWTSPEELPRTYSIDDKPVKVEVKEDKIVIEGPPEEKNLVKKTIEIKPLDSNTLEVVHRIKNISRWELEYSCWALTVMRRNGYAIIPVKAKCVDKPCLKPNRLIALWPYTKLNDPRLRFFEKYVVIKQDPSIKDKLKIGVRSEKSWLGYYIEGLLFIKTSTFHEDRTYPDYGVNLEVYTDSRILEIETLSPLERVLPMKELVHVEKWKLVNIGKIELNEQVFENIEKEYIQIQ